MLRRKSSDTTEPLSARQSRERAARAYLNVIMPGVLVLLTILTVVGRIVTPEDFPTPLLAVNAGFWCIHLTFLALVRRGRDPVLAAGVSLVLVTAVEYAALFQSSEPIGASAGLAILVAAAAYFLPVRAAVSLSIACGIGITVAARFIDSWGSTLFIPSTAFTVVATGLMVAFIMARVRRTETHLEHLLEEQATARTQLEAAGRTRDQLLANVSHELRTPLASTVGSIETLLRDDVSLSDDQRTQLMQVARDGGKRMSALVEDLLSIGVTRAHSLQLAEEPEPLAALVQDGVAGIEPGEGRTIRVEDGPDMLVRVDRNRILQVIGNLAVNAIKHGEGDVVVMTESSDDARALLHVLDSGPGIDPAHTEELFLPFARFSSRTDSTGLGLAICRAIVEAHGGTIEYARTEDDRTAFTVTLPTSAVT